MLELLIVLAAGSIVFASAAKCYEVVFKQVNIIKGVIDHVEEIHRLHYMMERDIFDASLITQQTDKSIRLQCDSIATSYFFSEAYVLRRQPGRADTFHVHTSDITFGVMAAFPATQLVNRIALQAGVFEKKENFLFKKQYPAETLLNLATEEQP